MKHYFLVGAVFLDSLIGASVLAAASPSVSGATAYVKAIYRGIPGSFSYRDVRYARELAKLMVRDAAISRRLGDEGELDADPFCDCQDTMPDYRIVRIRPLSSGRNAASVGVVLRNGHTSSFRIDLIREERHWVVSDVHSTRTPSLLAFMHNAIASEQRAATQINRSR